MSSAGARRDRRREHGRHLHPPQAARRTRAVRRRGHPGAAPEARAGPRHPRLPAEPAADPHRRPRSPRASTSSRCRAPTRRSSTSYAPLLEEQDPRAARLPGRHQRPADQEPAGQRRDRPRQGLGARRLGAADRDRALQRLRLAADLHHLHARPTRTRSSWSCCRSTNRPGGAVAALRPLRRAGKLVPLSAVASLDDGRRPADRQPLRPAARRSRSPSTSSPASRSATP